MDRPSPISTDLLFRHEVLRARLEIRDFFLGTIFREVYENIGQVLILAKMQMQSQGLTLIKGEADPNDSAGELVGQSITGLREMCKGLYPDAEILKDNGFDHGIRSIMQLIDPSGEYELKINERDREIESGIKLIVFNMILETLVCINKAKGALISLVMGFRKEEMALRLVYTGAVPLMDDDLEPAGSNEELTLKQRVHLLNGSLVVAKHGNDKSQLKLMLPINR